MANSLVSTTDPLRHRLLAGVPVTQRRLRPADISTSVLEAGDGPPLVLLHGGIECGGVVWAPVIAELATRHRLVIPDLPGLGESEPAARLDAAAFADWFGGLLELTCDEAPVVIAHSLGGTLAARYAARHPLPRLIVYGAPGVGPYRLPLALRVTAIRFGLRPTAANHERFERLAVLRLDALRERDPGWFDAFSGYLLARAALPHVKRTMRGLIATCTKRIPDEDLSRIAPIPALIWGRHDRFVPVALAESTAARLGWPLRVIENAGHVPHIERPHAFAQTVGALLAARFRAGGRASR